METLLRCERCSHGATDHDGSGCGASGCECRATREQVVGWGVEVAKDEIRAIWERPPGSLRAGA